ncbi:MAG: protein translocase subunit SecF [Clostridia bacterium]|nr:protein translocase subunit SecF [Clostridia bacterium]MBP3652396.1 protein translocase subunit SecF [Clostridia bacterium]
MKYTYTGKTRLFLCISGAIILIALIMQILGVGLNLGIDFTGGSLLNYSVGEEYDVADVEKILSSANYSGSQVTKAAPSDASIALQAQIAMQDEAAIESGEAHVHEDGTVHYGEHTEEGEEAEASLLNLDKSNIKADGMTDLQIRLKVEENEEDESPVRTLLEKEMTAKYPNFRFVSVDHVSAIAGRDLLSNAVKALLIAFACMLVYIAIRFDVFSGLAALFGLMHDVLIMCAFMVFFRAFFEVNSSFIAAVLTIVGYSINNTIIIFDRIRETAKKPGWSDKTRRDIVEVSVGNTLSRTINTSLTTLITLVALYVFGVSSIREFAFPLIVGMLAGTYSSVLLSGQVWAMWMEKRLARKAAKA